MERSEFEMYLGQIFEVISQEPAMTLELVELHGIQASQIPGTRTDPFALLFRGTPSAGRRGTLPRQVHIDAPPGRRDLCDLSRAGHEPGQTRPAVRGCFQLKSSIFDISHSRLKLR